MRDWGKGRGKEEGEGKKPRESTLNTHASLKKRDVNQSAEKLKLGFEVLKVIVATDEMIRERRIEGEYRQIGL